MPAPANERKWNAMFYLAGENNLAEECVFALKELKRARARFDEKVYENDPKDKKTINPGDEYFNKCVKVAAQLDAGGLGGKELRYILKRGDKDGFLKANDSEDTTETTYRGVLKDFIKWSIFDDEDPEPKRADHNLLVLSGHGNGLMSDFLSRDLDTPDKLSIPKIQWVLQEVQEAYHKEFGKKDDENFKIDVLGLDSCLMSMAEIGYELRDYVSYMVGAEGYEPNAGWPYERILSDLLTDPWMSPDELSCRIVERYVTYYKDFLPAGRSVDQSACDLNKSHKLATAIKKLADILIAKIEEPDPDPDMMRALMLAHWEAQTYKDDQYIDLYDFCDLLDRGPQPPKKPTESDPLPPKNPTGTVVMRDLKFNDLHIINACREIKKILRGDESKGDLSDEERMVRHSCYSGPAVQYSHGLSMYFPWSKVIESYKELEFANYTNWNTFLHKYIDKTRRDIRMCPAARARDLEPGQLFVSGGSGGFQFMESENKDAPGYNRVLSNKVGSMKNPPIDHVPCDCPPKFPNDSTWKDKSADNANSAEPPVSPTTENVDPKGGQ